MEEQCPPQSEHEPSLQEGDQVQVRLWSCLGVGRGGRDHSSCKLSELDAPQACLSVSLSCLSFLPQDGALPVKLISNETEAAEAVRNILSGRHLPPQQLQQPLGYPDTLQRSAEQILAGVRRPTAVQSAAAGQFVSGELRIACWSVIEYHLSTVLWSGHQHVYLRQQPVNLTTAPDYQITVFEHQNAALTLSSLDQVRSTLLLYLFLQVLHILYRSPHPHHRTCS